MPTNNTPFLTIFLLFLGLLRFDSFPGLEAATGKLASIPGLYVFGDSLVDAGNNNYLPISISKANYPHNGVDFPNKKPTGRFCNGKNAADAIGEFLLIISLRCHIFSVWNETISVGVMLWQATIGLI